jgi:hypothetical protein
LRSIEAIDNYIGAYHPQCPALHGLSRSCGELKPLATAIHYGYYSTLSFIFAYILLARAEDILLLLSPFSVFHDQLHEA